MKTKTIGFGITRYVKFRKKIVIGALDPVKAAQTTPQGAVQTLWVNVAATAWRNLAQYAAQHLGSTP